MNEYDHAWNAAIRQAILVCEMRGQRNFNWASENADRYHIQADWALAIARDLEKLIRKE